MPGSLKTGRPHGDEQFWKLIVSPEFGDRVDLSRLTRDLIKQMEKDLGTELEWVAVEHHNTEHPHVHVVIRGIRSDRESLRLSRDYVQHGIRSIASDLCTRQLGYRTELDAIESERREISEMRFTSIDRRLLRDANESAMDLEPHHFSVIRNFAQTGLSEPARIRTQHEVSRLAVLGQNGSCRIKGTEHLACASGLRADSPGDAANHRPAEDTRRSWGVDVG